eukprot:COSAG06_NODE_1961_length_7974_cov_43.011808_6_plen_78_part_00
MPSQDWEFGDLRFAMRPAVRRGPGWRPGVGGRLQANWLRRIGSGCRSALWGTRAPLTRVVCRHQREYIDMSTLLVHT